MKKRLKKKQKNKNEKEIFEPRYFQLSKGNESIYIRRETVEGILSDEARNNPDHITYLMAQDIWDLYGRDYNTTHISEEEYNKKAK
ncbi:hypothetical protein [Salirhabdus salicampi]|uniref:hypothetical protein n=1 Tax=Salirhabdus salicampi TaxID=476102 RepID=UPI0020C3B280|nr:hypothetical protein [Salirhabdus salicampi]MCP8616358.1 hypothetical protein [Salirhabdus salicampi]